MVYCCKDNKKVEIPVEQYETNSIDCDLIWFYYAVLLAANSLNPFNLWTDKGWWRTSSE